MDNRPIGVFDSGLGGLTAVKELHEVLPNESIIYFGDTGRVPYGSRSRDTIIKYTRQDINFLLSFDIKLILIACGTASAAAFPTVSEDYKTHIKGVVKPSAKLAAASTKNNKIAVLGTASTIKSKTYDEFLNKYAKEAQILSKACPLFVPIVENGRFLKGDPLASLVVEEYLEEVKAFGADTVILGCTHYPLLKDVIGNYLGEGVTLIDAGQAAAWSVKNYLQKKDMLSCSTQTEQNKYFVSDSVDNFANLAKMFLGSEIGNSINQIDIEKY